MNIELINIEYKTKQIKHLKKTKWPWTKQRN